MRGLSVQLSAVASRADATAIVSKAKAAKIDTLFYNVSAQYTPGSSFDRLGTLIEVAGAAGMAVFPWLCPGADPYFTSRWPVKGGGFTDYGNAAARAAMADGVASLVARYPGLKGVTTDYIRQAEIDGADYAADDVTAAVYGMEAEVGAERAFVVTVKAYEGDWNRWGQQWPTWLATWLAQGKKKRYAMPMVYSPTKYGDFAPHVQAWLDAGVPLANIMPKMSVIDTQIAGEKTPKDLASWKKEFVLWRKVRPQHVAIWDERALALPGLLAEFSALELAETAPEEDLETRLALLRALVAKLREMADTQEAQVVAMRENATELERQAEELESVIVA